MPSPENLIHETSISAGTGNFTLAAENGRQRFSEGFSTGGTDVFDYYIANRDEPAWEVGTGHLLDANTLVRDTVVESSNAGALVNFGAGTKDVTNDVTAANILSVDVGLLGRSLPLDADGDSLIDGSTDDQIKHIAGNVVIFQISNERFESLTAFSLAGDISATIAADTHNWAPAGLATASTIRVTVSNSVDLTGINLGSDGKLLILHNLGPEILTLPTEDTRSTAAGRFLFGGEKHLHPNESMSLRYDASSARWRALSSSQAEHQPIMVACSDETSDLTTGTAKITFRMPYAYRLFQGNAGLRANVNTAPTGTGITVDVNQNGTSIMTTTKLTINATETTCMIRIQRGSLSSCIAISLHHLRQPELRFALGFACK